MASTINATNGVVTSGDASGILELQSNGTSGVRIGTDYTTQFLYAAKEAQIELTTADIDLSKANYFSDTVTGNITYTVSNVPSANVVASFILNLTNGGSATVTWWSNVKWASGTAPTLTASGRDVLGFFTYDNGTTWTGIVMAKDVK